MKATKLIPFKIIYIDNQMIKKTRQHNYIPTLSKASGFTLLESLIALTILTLTVSISASVNHSVGKNIRHTKTVQESIIVLDNTLSQYQAMGNWPELGQHNITVNQLKAEWEIILIITETDSENFRKAIINIKDNDQKINSHSLTTYYYAT